MQHSTKQGDPRSTKKRAKQREAAHAKVKRERKRGKAEKRQKSTADAAKERENCKWRAAQRAMRVQRAAKQAKKKGGARVVASAHRIRAGNPATAAARSANRRAQLAAERARRAQCKGKVKA
jgi:hypothetical protein